MNEYEELKLTNDNFNLEAVMKNSEAISEKFNTFDADLLKFQNFEDSISYVNAHMKNDIPFYNKGYGLKILGNEYGFTKKSLNDWFAKSSSEIKIQHFNAIKMIADNGYIAPLTILKHVGSATKRDSLKSANTQHKHIISNSNILGIVSPKNPAGEGRFRASKLFKAVRNVIALNSTNTFNNSVSFNESTGDVRAKFYFQNLDVPNGNSQDHGFGGYIGLNLAGNGSAQGGVAKVDWRCNNGQIRAHKLSNSGFSIVQSSEKNIFEGLTKYFYKHSNFHELVDEQQFVFKAIDNGDYAVLDNNEYSDMFYEVIAKSFVTAINMEKSQHERALISSMETSVNIASYLKEIRRKYSNILTMSDIERLLVIVDNDETIDQDHTEYTAVQAITRMANSPSISTQRSERLQTLGDELLLEPITV